MKVNELSGYWLNYWTAKVEGKALSSDCDASGTDAVLIGTGAGDLELFDPANDWADGGPIIEREEIDVQCGGWEWGAWRGSNPDWEPVGEAFGDTPLIAAMRAYVASKFGEEVPDSESAAPARSN